MKNQKLSATIVLCCATLALLAACHGAGGGRHKVKNDCSAMFETRDANNNKITKKKTVDAAKDAVEEEVATECKVLEVKIDENTKCEIVGSDRIEKLSQMINTNRNDRITIVAPDKKVKDLALLANKYLKVENVNLNKYLDSDIFKNFDFDYKGMKCTISNKKFVIWTGGKQTILTVE